MKKKEFIHLSEEDLDLYATYEFKSDYTTAGDNLKFVTLYSFKDFVFNFHDINYMYAETIENGNIIDYNNLNPNTDFYIKNYTYVIELQKGKYKIDRLFLSEKGYNKILGLDETQKIMRKSKNKMEFLNNK